MTVTYPRKFRHIMGDRDILTQVVQDRELHLIALNRYRYSEQRSCKDLTDVIEQLQGQPSELVRDLSRHVADEARHAMWLTELLADLGADIGTPPGTSYVDELDRLVDREHYDPQRNLEDGIIAFLATINVGEKRACEYFSAHIVALKEAPQTEENRLIRETLDRIFPEEAAHVRWGNRWLAQLARKSPEHRQKVEQAKAKYAAIEQAAFEAAMDITLGAELRRLEHLLQIASTLPLWQRATYLIERLPRTLLALDLQHTRLEVAQQAWKRDPQAFIEQFVPLFLGELNMPSKPSKAPDRHCQLNIHGNL